MGQPIDETNFTDRDFSEFRKQVLRDIAEFRRILDTPGFGAGPSSFGAELELYLANSDGEPVCCNNSVQSAFGDKRLTLELNQFNLEYNLDPVAAAGRPFSIIEKHLHSVLLKLDALAADYGAGVVPIGILPTLKQAHLGRSVMTDMPRYHALDSVLRARRGEDFSIHIDGADSLNMTWSDVTLEGANTSFQFHYRVEPDQFRDTWNAALLVTPLITALAANSPLLFGKRLWEETRVPLFEQSVDSRVANTFRARMPPRVGFGNGWLRHDIHELFVEGVSLFPPLLPRVPDSGEPAGLDAMRMHQGSIWSWIRPVYDPVDGGHLRLELRTLPAGPSCADMCSSAAVFIGLIEALKPSINSIIPCLPFRYAEENFNAAARYGLDALLLWPDPDNMVLAERRAGDILQLLLKVAKKGLVSIGVDETEADRCVSIAGDTVASGQNGSRWQLASLENLLEPGASITEEALAAVVTGYRRNALGVRPVSQWPLLKA